MHNPYCPGCGGNYPCACQAIRSPRRDPEKTLRGEVIGFRGWHVRLGRRLTPPRGLLPEIPRPEAALEERTVAELWSLGYGETRWCRGRNDAVCRASTADHDAPHEACGCGLYGWHDPKAAMYTALHSGGAPPNDLPTVVAGVVKAWGRLEVHQNGFRAQHAEIVMLAIPEAMRLLNRECAEATVRLADEWGIRLVTLEDFEAPAREFGDPVAAEDRPSEKWAREQPMPSLGPGGLVPRFGQGGSVRMGLPLGWVPPFPNVHVAMSAPDPGPKRPKRLLTHVLIGIALYVAVYVSGRLLGVPLFAAIGAAMVMQAAGALPVYRLALRIRCWWRETMTTKACLHTRDAGARDLVSRDRQKAAVGAGDRCPHCGWRLKLLKN